MTTFSIAAHINAALTKRGLQIRSREEAKQMAHDWHRQRRPELPENVAALPGYQSGSRASKYHEQLEAAIQAAMKPDISKLATIINPQNTNPLAARDIERANTPPEISNIPTLVSNPATPTPETRATLFQDVPAKAETLIGEDITERRPVVRNIHAPRKDTVNIPAINAEILLESMMRKPAHEQSTGENERLPEKHWIL